MRPNAGGARPAARRGSSPRPVWDRRVAHSPRDALRKSNPNEGVTLPRRLSFVDKPRTRPESGVPASPAIRADAAANAIASVRAEGLDPGRAEPLLAAWARGELTDEQLEQARLRILRERSTSAE